jgi:hypothetical protein
MRSPTCGFGDAMRFLEEEGAGRTLSFFWIFRTR